MNYISTRNASLRVSGAEAIVGGIAPDGGLYVPETMPEVTAKEREALTEMDYPARAAFIIGKYLPELKDELPSMCEKAYSRFDGDPAPLVKIEDNFYLLELWHGPTHAFKDMALTLLPYLLTGSKRVLGRTDRTLILVATSGDTGKAALEGFRDVDGTDCIVFYPSGGVSELQQFQMQTQKGENVFVSAIEGNFDDAQTAVKNIFTDDGIRDKLASFGYNLSSANSINWGRLVPQIAYYFSAYADLVSGGEIEDGDKVAFSVPTGNFGNILACYYAMKMGLPVERLVCASNSNNVLTDLFDTGIYDVRREFYKTISPSMDILVSSNFERLLFEISGRDDKLTARRMEELKANGKYVVSDRELSELSQIFFADYSSDEATKETIADFFEDTGYILDPHSAVAVSAADAYVGDEEIPIVTVCTASPFKFVGSVLEAIGTSVPKSAIKALEKLEDETALPLPESLKELETLEKRFTGVVGKDGIADVVINYAKERA